MKADVEKEEDSKSGPEMAQTNGPDKRNSADRGAKTHQDFWRDRLVRRTYTDRDGRTIQMPEWQVRIAFKGRREWFNLGSPNKA